MNTWITEYAKQLAIAVNTHPDEYGCRPDSVPVIVERMRDAFAKKHYNKDSRAIKATCKVFKIKFTYEAINHFIANHV